MKKKLISFIRQKVCGGKTPVLYDGEYYYYNNGAMIMRTKEKLLESEPLTNSLSRNFFKSLEEFEDKRFEFPDISEIINGIKSCNVKSHEIVGVKFTEDSPIINARWLKDAIKATNAKGMYYFPQKGKFSPVLLYEEDNCMSDNTLLILPINSNTESLGYRYYSH